jgi:hypothetical protein
MFRIVTIEWRCPSFSEDLDPLEVDFVDFDGRKSFGLRFGFLHLVVGDEQLGHFVDR